MKKFFISIVFICYSLVLYAMDLPYWNRALVSWDAVSNQDIQGYTLYYGQASGKYTTMIDCHGTNYCVVNGLITGYSYYFVVVDYDSRGNESPFSNEVKFQIKDILINPHLDTNGWFVFSVSNNLNKSYIIQANNTNLDGWIDIGTNTSPFTFTDSAALLYPQRFYRTVGQN
jgi:hypothetical protein